MCVCLAAECRWRCTNPHGGGPVHLHPADQSPQCRLSGQAPPLPHHRWRVKALYRDQTQVCDNKQLLWWQQIISIIPNDVTSVWLRVRTDCVNLKEAAWPSEPQRERLMVNLGAHLTAELGFFIHHLKKKRTFLTIKKEKKKQANKAFLHLNRCSQECETSREASESSAVFRMGRGGATLRWQSPVKCIYNGWFIPSMSNLSCCLPLPAPVQGLLAETDVLQCSVFFWNNNQGWEHLFSLKDSSRARVVDSGDGGFSSPRNHYSWLSSLLTSV